ncbi:Metal-dependent phosphoesterase [Spironucleus salmonicida]|uniref:Metal-dependent phosphoesterase n=1 Tax=Spironucleus salmonicida TaxID=348837 RepID=V6LWQ2_9EUKA|nr:Metal-dependent phosphoesterase [Spironucleus salmonicida]|eukprot:EST45224.1 PHP domain-containing protein [Spironucleus salmonicida]
MIIDLHSHTVNSDGQYSTSQLISLAIMQNISYLAITDHDDMRSYYDLQNLDLNNYEDINIHLLNNNHPFNYSRCNYFKPHLTIIPGVEFSTVSTCNDQEYHLIILFSNLNTTGINEIQSLLSDHYKYVLQQICSKNSTYLQCLDNNSTHFKLLFDLVSSSNLLQPCQNFYACLRDNFNIKMPLKFQNLEQVLILSQKYGFHTILPHPFREMKDNFTFSKCLKEFKRLGLNSVELEHFSNSYQQKILIQNLAQRLDFSLSIGSDFHSQRRKLRTGIDLGYFEANLRVIQNTKDRIINEIFGKRIIEIRIQMVLVIFNSLILFFGLKQ